MFAKTKITLTCFLYYFSGQSLQKVLRSLFLLPHFLSLCTWLIFTLFVHVYLLFSLSSQKLLFFSLFTLTYLFSYHCLHLLFLNLCIYFFFVFSWTFFLPYLHTNSKNVALFCIPLLFSVMRTISFFHSLHMLTAPFLQLCVYLLFSSSLHTLIFSLYEYIYDYFSPFLRTLVYSSLFCVDLPFSLALRTTGSQTAGKCTACDWRTGLLVTP